MKKYKAIIVGSGCAAYACALNLCKLGITNIAIVTEDKNSGTSRNTGSDKQTYYKLSLSTEGKDDALSMAKSFYDGGSIHGDFALIEASNSARCFMRLVDLGVPFPTNQYGAYVGYQTDHDTTCRATSIGPLTSKVMTEKLESAVLAYGIDLLDKRLVVEIMKTNNRVVGVVAVNKSNINDNYGLETILADNVVLACGAPAGIYKDSVFPASQNGATNLALDLGLNMRSFSEWQYGIASVKFRWNLSGSYQQVLPRYVSVDSNGQEREFLNEYYADTAEMLNNIFLKGYQWPFDYQKINGSSQIDKLIYDQIFVYSRKVYLDYTKNCKGYDFDKLPKVVADYLTNSGAVENTPIKRLQAMNPKAIKLYKDHNIDLTKEYLEINISSQHNNGGVQTDINWQTDINGLYVIGETAGTFGVYRPGGSALNDTQVSALRASENIAKDNYQSSDLINCLENFLAKHKQFISLSVCADDNLDEISQKIKLLMSKNASFIRSKQGLQDNITQLLAVKNLCVASMDRIPKLYKVYGNLKTAIALSKAIINTMDDTGSRGSALYYDNGKLIEENVKYRQYVALTNDDKLVWEPVRQIPKPNDWFESAWRDFDKRRNL